MGKSGRSAKGDGRGRGDADAGKPDDEPDERAESVSFEHALGRLEETVTRLESGEMPLEEALELFETGVKLSRDCSARLDDAERRIEILVADREDAEAVDFESAEDWEDDSDDTSDEDVTAD